MYIVDCTAVNVILTNEHVNIDVFYQVIVLEQIYILLI